MKIGLIGMNSTSADLPLREAFTRCAKRVMQRDDNEQNSYSAVLLATCNRVEIYFSADDLAEAHSEILALLRAEMDGAFAEELYSFFGAECFLHLVRVTAGLDSAIISESEIQGQVKNVYASASISRDLPQELHYLFQKALRASKMIRTTYPLPQGMPTLEQTVFQLAENFIPEMRSCPLFFVGHSEINRQMITYFKRRGAEKIVLCTRSPYAAHEFAEKVGVEVVGWDKLATWSAHQLLICATSQNHYLIHPQSRVVSTRCIIDLGMPRNVSPILKKDPHIHLFNIEEVGAMVRSSRMNKMSAVAASEEMASSLTARYMQLFVLKTSRAAQQFV